MRKERYEHLKRMYESKHVEDVCGDAIEAIHAEEIIEELGRKIREKQQQLIALAGGYDSEMNKELEELMDLYNERESKLLEALYILGVCDAEVYL
jgi:DNA mismatch repair ATPase MutS